MFFIVAGWRLAIPHGISVRWSIYIDLHTHGLHYIYAIHDICRSTESSRVLNVVDLSPSHPLSTFPLPPSFTTSLSLSSSLSPLHTRARAHTHTHARTHTHTNTYTHTHIHTRIYTCTHTTHTHAYTHAHIHTRIHTHAYAHTHTRTHTRIYTHTFKNIYPMLL